MINIQKKKFIGKIISTRNTQMSIKEREKDTVLGVKWSFISNFGQQLTLFINTIILVRLLSPADFGLMGMATVVIGFLDVFKNFGISSAIIQSDDTSDSFLSTLFWVNCFFGALLTVILYVASPLAEMYYREPRVTSLVRWLSINFLISSSCITHKALLEKKLAFKTLAKLEIFSIIIGAIVGISMAFFEYGVWSLVYQTITRVFAFSLFLWLFVDYRPKFIFSLGEIKKVFAFSFYLTSFSISNYILRNADYLIIGRFLGAQSLGYYTLAYKLMLFPVQNLSAVIGRVLFPVYSKIQHDNDKIKKMVLKTSSMIGFITIPLMLGLMAIAYPLIISLFGDKWEPAIPVIIILAPIGLLQSISVPINTIFLAKARTDLMLYWGLIAGTITIIFYSIGLRWGIIGVASGYAFSGFLLLYPSLLIRFRLIALSMSKFLFALYKPLLIGIFMAGSVVLIRYLLPDNLNNYSQLFILLPFGVVCYFFLSFLFNVKQIHEVMKFAKGES